MKEAKDNKTKKMIIDVVIMALVVGFVALIIILLTQKKETKIIETYDKGKTSGLVCTSSGGEADFFDSSASEKKHELKLVYYNDVIDKMSYEFNGKYDSNESVKHDDAVLHAKYNTYMGEHNVKSEILTPVFQVSDDKLTIKLYLDSYKSMNSTIGKLFYISSASLDSVAKQSLEETKKYYEKKGFSCIIND